MTQKNGTLDQIKRLLNMDKQDKQPDKLAKLETLLEDNTFLNMINKEDKLEYHKLLYNATFETFHSRSIIQMLGNYSTKFYVILEGSIDVFIHQKSDEECLYGARQLSKGECMNEISLITNEKSSVQYQVSQHIQTCSVLVLQKSHFQQFSHLIRINLDMNIFYYKNLPMFWNQKDKHLYLFHLLTTHHQFKNNQTVFLEGDQSDLVFIIKSGQFGVYKHFQDLQFRKLNDLSHNKYMDSLGSSTVKLQEFHHNKNIQTRILKENEMFGEEDIIKRRNRSYSVICESNEGELIVMSKATFKIVLMSIEGVRNYILSRLKVKEQEVSRILDKQSTQVSSARIHILERDQLKIATTQDFVKSRSFLNVSRSNYSNKGNISFNQNNLTMKNKNQTILNGESFLGNSITINNNNSNFNDGQNLTQSKILTENNNTRFVKNVPRANVNHILNQENNQYGKSGNIENNRLSLPSIHQTHSNHLYQPQTNTLPSTKQYNATQYDNRYDKFSSMYDIAHKEENLYNNHLSNGSEQQQQQQEQQSAQQLGQQEQLKQGLSSKRNKSEQIGGQNNVENNLPYSIITPKGNDYQNILSPKQIFNSTQNLEYSPSHLNTDKGETLRENKESLRDKVSSRVSQNSNTNRRDSKLFENFTRNSTLYLQKYQINQEKKAIFSSVGKRNEQNDEGLDNKGRQLSEQIQSYINKYEIQMNKNKSIINISEESQNIPQSKPLIDNINLSSSHAKIIYKKPLTDEEYANQIKKQNDLEFQKNSNSTKSRNFKINFYQQKS